MGSWSSRISVLIRRDIRCTEDLNTHLFKDNRQMTRKHVKRYSPSLIIREMQIKTTIRYHLSHQSERPSSQSRNNKCSRRYGEKWTLLHCWWECKLVQPLWRTVFKTKIKKRAESLLALSLCTGAPGEESHGGFSKKVTQARKRVLTRKWALPEPWSSSLKNYGDKR